jgi:exonuclease SbcC
MRAVRWALENKPRGDAFVRVGADECKVSVVMDDAIITRAKDSENWYSLRTSDDKTRYVAFGADRPQAVIDAARVDEINFQGQHDSPFWFTLSAGEVAKQMNSIVDLSIIDDVVGSLAAESRKSKVELEVTTSRLETAKKDEAALEWTVEAHATLSQPEKDSKELEETCNRLDKLEGFTGSLAATVKRLETYTQMQSDIGLVLSYYETVISCETRALRLGSLIDEIERLQSIATHTKMDLTELDSLFSTWDQTRSLQQELEGLLVSLTDAQEKLVDVTNEYQQTQKRLAKEFAVCPLCGR